MALLSFAERSLTGGTDVGDMLAALIPQHALSAGGYCSSNAFTRNEMYHIRSSVLCLALTLSWSQVVLFLAAAPMLVLVIAAFDGSKLRMAIGELIARNRVFGEGFRWRVRWKDEGWRGGGVLNAKGGIE